MEAHLRVPYRDTTADQLVWRLGEPLHPALATLELAVAGGRIDLRLLGSSHQIVFTAADAFISEVVACGSSTPNLPAAAERALGDWDYRFRSRIHRPPPGRFGHWVDRLVACLGAHPAAIVGRFPGSDHAITALLAGPGTRGREIAGAQWRTWHAYPQDGRLVATSTAVHRGRS